MKASLKVMATAALSMTLVMQASSQENLCASNAVDVAATFTDLNQAEMIFTGFWPAVSICHAIVVLERTPSTARVIYVWYGLPGSAGAQIPDEAEQVQYEAEVLSDGGLQFQVHWGPTIRLYQTEVTYTDSTGMYRGTAQALPTSG